MAWAPSCALTRRDPTALPSTPPREASLPRPPSSLPSASHPLQPLDLTTTPEARSCARIPRAAPPTTASPGGPRASQRARRLRSLTPTSQRATSGRSAPNHHCSPHTCGSLRRGAWRGRVRQPAPERPSEGGGGAHRGGNSEVTRQGRPTANQPNPSVSAGCCGCLAAGTGNARRENEDAGKTKRAPTKSSLAN